MSDENDPLAALSSAAQSRPGKVRPRVKPQPRQTTAAAGKRKGPAKSNVAMYITFATMGVIVILGVILAVVVINSKNAEADEASKANVRQRPHNDDKAFFPNVKSQQ